MGTGTNQDQLVILIIINKQPIGFDMTLTARLRSHRFVEIGLKTNP